MKVYFLVFVGVSLADKMDLTIFRNMLSYTHLKRV